MTYSELKGKGHWWWDSAQVLLSSPKQQTTQASLHNPIALFHSVAENPRANEVRDEFLCSPLRAKGFMHNLTRMWNLNRT